MHQTSFQRSPTKLVAEYIRKWYAETIFVWFNDFWFYFLRHERWFPQSTNQSWVLNNFLCSTFPNQRNTSELLSSRLSVSVVFSHTNHRIVYHFWIIINVLFSLAWTGRRNVLGCSEFLQWSSRFQNTNPYRGFANYGTNSNQPQSLFCIIYSHLRNSSGL